MADPVPSESGSTEAGAVGEPTETPAPADDRAPGWRTVASAVAVLLVALGAAVGGNVLDLRTRLFGSVTPEPRPAAVGREAASGSTSGKTVLRSQPWWQDVETFTGSGTTTTAPFTITSGAIQWRVRWSCDQGRLLVRAVDQPDPVVDESCPGEGIGYQVIPGETGLEVVSDGEWVLHVDQQIDVPLVEPPLEAMSAPGAEVVARTTFYGMDQTGTGEVRLYRLPNGRYALRLEDFYITPNVDLEIQMSEARIPRTSRDYMSNRSALVAFLPITTGSQNFMVPKSVDPTEYPSIVIWCPLINSAYAAAKLPFD